MTGSSNHYRLIALCGRASAGKDTCADVLQASFGFQRIAFADALREEISHSFGVDPRDLADRVKKEQRTPALAIGRSDDARFIRLMASVGVCISSPRSAREIMRWWATEYRREMDGEEYWVLRARDALDVMFRHGARRVVFTDLRFQNEAAFIWSYGGDVWRIRRDIADRQSADHRSEAEMEAIPADLTIANNRSMEAFACAIRDTFQVGRAPGLPRQEDI